MLKEIENAENIDIDTDNDDSFDEQYQFTNPRARFRAHGFFESSEEESTTSGKQKAKQA